MGDAAYLAGKTHLPYRRHRAEDRFIQITGGDGYHRRQVGGRLIQSQAADDIQIGITLADFQADK